MMNLLSLGTTAAGFGGDLYMNRKETDAIGAANQQNIMFQYDMANTGIQRRTWDAKKAGIHPLAAIGASTPSPSIASQPEHGSNAKDVLAKALTMFQLSTERKAVEADVVLKQAQASEIARKADESKHGRPLYIPVYDQVNNKTIQLMDPELSESLQGAGPMLMNVRGNMFDFAGQSDEKKTLGILPQIGGGAKPRKLNKSDRNILKLRKEFRKQNPCKPNPKNRWGDPVCPPYPAHLRRK